MENKTEPTSSRTAVARLSDEKTLAILKFAPDANTQTNSAVNTNAAPTMLPDENTLVSFNPIVALNWPSDEQLYFQTAYIKRMKNEADSVTSFPRWHRLILTPQATVLNK